MIRAYVEPQPSADFTGIDSGLNLPGTRHGMREEQSDRKIEFTIAYMMEHLNQSLPVARLAALANMSPSHYTALFKRRTGCAPIDYFIRLRMRHARDLLMATTMNVKEVAAALGYEDPFYFSRVFKSVNQLAPSDYRVMHRAVNGHEVSSARELQANHSS
jgi:transcriptional regulator GlxA family with amidase domain